ncbi:MAG: replication initiator protein [Arizlama microvirus]|nr:MAG: replication initiator protein [Arizlama microvirus]
MTCFKPLVGYQSRELNETGKRSIVFDYTKGFVDLPVFVPCGQCSGCRSDKAREWAARCIHEASLYRDNCFITLTFDDAHLHSKGSLVVSDFQKFIKRLRKRFDTDFRYVSNGRTFFCPSRRFIRYFHCGEYGSNFNRPHHHACLFNFDFPDKYLWRDKDGVRLYRSPILECLWPYGFSTIGDVTYESAAYVARYVMKKIGGDMAPGHYNGRKPEYVTMSRRPGIGKDWFDIFSSDVYPHDFIVVAGGRKQKPARYYDNLLDKVSHDTYNSIKGVRERQARDNIAESSGHRLAARRRCHEAKLKLSERRFENGDKGI